MGIVNTSGIDHIVSRCETLRCAVAVAVERRAVFGACNKPDSTAALHIRHFTVIAAITEKRFVIATECAFFPLLSEIVIVPRTV